MPRSKTSVTRKSRHKKYLKAAKGYYGARSRLYRTARETVERAWAYAYRDRRQKNANSEDFGLHALTQQLV